LLPPAFLNYYLNDSRGRAKGEPEFELLDAGIFDEDRYFDIFVEYAKANFEDLLIKMTIANRGPEAANLRVLPTVWFRNTWSWGDREGKPSLRARRSSPNAVMEMHCPGLGKRCLHCEGSPELLFTENETNYERLFQVENASAFVKDGINDYVLHGASSVNPELSGTKASAHYKLSLQPGAEAIIRLRLSDSNFERKDAFAGFETVLAIRKREADEFYSSVIPQNLSADAQNVMRQAFAGMLWSKQFYHYVVKNWLEGDHGNPQPPAERKQGGNREWTHLYNADIISMPDKWEYP
jgi:hypothetical protein